MLKWERWQWLCDFFQVALLYAWYITLACLYLSVWKVFIMRGIHMEEGLVVNHGQLMVRKGACCKTGKELGRSAPTADATSPWIGWIAPINAAPHKSTWLASRSGLDLEAIWLLLCSTDSDKDPTEAQWVHVGPAPTSPPHELFSELLPVPRPIWSRQLMWFTRTLRAGTPKHQVIQHRVCMSICPHVRVIPCTQGCPQQWPLTVYGMG